jgi:SAM-dependent methyltransferase
MSESTITHEDLPGPEADPAASHREERDAPTDIEPALPTTLTRPTPLPPPDDHQLPTLNRFWAARQLGAAAGWRRLRTRLAGYARPLIQMLPWRQNAFNAALVDHLNRASAREHAARDATTRSLDGLHDDLGAVVAYLHTNIPAYRDALRLPRSLAESLSALGDDMRKRWESLATREQRLEARQEQDAMELRLALGMLQRSAAVLKREVERGLQAGLPGASSTAGSAGPVAGALSNRTAPGGDQSPPQDGAAASQLAGSRIDSYQYVGFEDSFRGPAGEIRDRLATYLPLFSGASDVLDFGCGRGEFLELLREHGVSARGVDINHEMVEGCRALGLDVTESDGLAFLEALPDGALGGFFGSQVVEHLQPDQLLGMVSLAFHKLRPGAPVVLETINPACWFAFFESYLRDVTHVRPIHPDTLKFLLTAGGFQQVTVRMMAPYPEQGKLQPIVVPERSALGADPLIDLAETFNDNVDKLNGLIFTYLDYAATAVRP